MSLTKAHLSYTSKALFSLILTSLFICITFTVYHQQNEEHLIDNFTRLHTANDLLHELRISTNQQTAFAKLYALTGSERWLALFEQVMAIRNGTATFPEGTSITYWEKVLNPEFNLIKLNDISSIDSFPVIDKIKKWVQMIMS